jgi:hypothetical protein
VSIWSGRSKPKNVVFPTSGAVRSGFSRRTGSESRFPLPLKRRGVPPFEENPFSRGGSLPPAGLPSGTRGAANHAEAATDVAGPASKWP